MGANTGGRFTSLTVTRNVLASLRLGEPLSVTRTFTGYVPGPCASLGRQVSSPVLGLMPTPCGPETRVEVSVLAGRSGSVAVTGSIKVSSSLRVGLAVG